MPEEELKYKSLLFQYKITATMNERGKNREKEYEKGGCGGDCYPTCPSFFSCFDCKDDRTENDMEADKVANKILSLECTLHYDKLNFFKRKKKEKELNALYMELGKIMMR